MANKKQIKALAESVIDKAKRMNFIGFNYSGKMTSSATQELKSIDIALNEIEAANKTKPLFSVDLTKCCK